MNNLIKVELYKFYKRNMFLFVLLFNIVSVFYALGVSKEWSWVVISGKYDLIQYMGAMWELLFMIGIPLIFFMFSGANILGGEKVDGQILLEVTRVAERKKLVSSKIISVIVLITFYFVVCMLTSAASYAIFVHGTPYSTEKWFIFNSDNINLMISCVTGFLYIIVSTVVAMRVSLRYGTVPSTIIGITLYVVLSMASRIPGIDTFVPGYYALSQTAVISPVNTVKQFVILGIIICAVFYASRKKIAEIDF